LIDNIYNIIQRNLHSQHKIHESFRFAILLAIAGGFLDSYTYIGRGGVFANAQTGNIVLLAIYASKGELMNALTAIPPILAFIVGIIVTQAIQNNSSRLYILSWQRAVLIFEIIVFFIIGFIPNTIPDIIVTVTVSFMASVQVASFPKLVNDAYSSTMSTGNLKAASKAAYIAFTKRDREAAIRSIRFFTIVFSFLFGAFLGGLLTSIIGVKAIWGDAIVLVFALILFNIFQEESNNETV